MELGWLAAFFVHIFFFALCCMCCKLKYDLERARPPGTGIVITSEQHYVLTNPESQTLVQQPQGQRSPQPIIGFNLTMDDGSPMRLPYPPQTSSGSAHQMPMPMPIPVGSAPPPLPAQIDIAPPSYDEAMTGDQVRQPSFNPQFTGKQ